MKGYSIPDSFIESSHWIIPMAVGILGLVTLALFQNELIVIAGFAALLALLASGFPRVRLLLLIALLPFAHAGIGLEILPGFGVYNIYAGFIILLFLIRYAFVEHASSNKIPVLPLSFLMFFAFIPSLIHSPDLTQSGLSFLNLLVSILTAVAVFSLLSQVQSQSFVTTLLKLFVIVASIVSLYGIYESIASASVFALFTGRMFFKLFGDVNYYSSYLLMAVALSMGFVFIATRWLHKIFYIGASFVLTIGIVATVSRSALVTLVLIVLGYVIYLFLYQKGSRKIISLFLIAFIITAVVVLMFTDIGSQIVDIFTLTQRVETVVIGRDASLEQRLSILKVSMDMIKSNFVIGTGFGTFENIFPYYQGALLSTGFERSTHNTLIRILAETGIVGLIPSLVFISALLLYLIRGIRYVRDDDKMIIFTFFSAIIAFLIMCLSLDMMFEPHFWVTCGLGLFFVHNVLQRDNRRASEVNNESN